MNMSFNRKYLVPIALLVAGCSGSGGGYDYGANDNPPPGATSTAFVPFIKAQLAQTSDTAEPVNVNDLQFQLEDENETAFNDVLQ
jgi:hypothetical protein